MTIGLPVSRLINVQVTLDPLAAQYANFGTLLLMGESDVISASERIRLYNNIEGVTEDFGTITPEFLAAERFFSQVPQPNVLLIGRWQSASSTGILTGGALSSTAQSMTAWKAVTNPTLYLIVDGILHGYVWGVSNPGPQVVGGTGGTAGTITPITAGPTNGTPFSNCDTLAAVAAIVDGVSGATFNCSYDDTNNQFIFSSKTSGANSSVACPSGTWVSPTLNALMNLTPALHAVEKDGAASESALASVVAADTGPIPWYGLMFTRDLSGGPTGQAMQIAAYIEAAGNPHIFGMSTSDVASYDRTSTTDLAYLLKAAGYKRTFIQYSSQPYVEASYFGRAFTVNFQANKSTLTMMYKQEPGVTPETLTQNQASALTAKRCNYYVYYNNDTRILENGVMCGEAYFDEIHGLDWLANQVQTNLYNLLYLTPTKIPQTNPGMNILRGGIEAAFIKGVNNGLIAPGTWTSANTFGVLNTGDYLSKGYYIYVPSVDDQPQPDREARKSVPFQCAVKLAGAVHTVDCIINVNR